MPVKPFSGTAHGPVSLESSPQGGVPLSWATRSYGARTLCTTWRTTRYRSHKLASTPRTATSSKSEQAWTLYLAPLVSRIQLPRCRLPALALALAALAGRQGASPRFPRQAQMPLHSLRRPVRQVTGLSVFYGVCWAYDGVLTFLLCIVCGLPGVKSSSRFRVELAYILRDPVVASFLYV